MKIIVNNTNIFIDLHSIGLLEAMCMLPYEIHTVDFVIAEIIDETQRTAIDNLVASGTIHVKRFSSEEVMEIVAEQAAVSGNLSITDCSVCYYARKRAIPMLTGDRQLRRYAEQQSIEVHGVLFLFDCMVDNDIITPAVAAQKLKELLAINARLPKTEIRNRIAAWTKQ